MGKVVKVYKVKNTKTGLYRTAGGGWSATGKTWNNLGHLKSSISGEGYYGTYNNNDKQEPGPEIVIIEIIVQETEGNTVPMRDLILRQRRLIEVEKKYGQAFRDLVTRIEDQGQTEQFQWVLAASGKWDHANQCIRGDFEEMLNLVKDMKLKQNKDYKKASHYSSGGVIAFANKAHAMQVRLAMSGKCHGIDIRDYVETNLDEEDNPVV